MRNPGAMNHDETALHEVVLFDIAGVRAVDELRERLQAHRLVWLHEREGAQLVAASLRTEPGDLAALLRIVEAWIAERGLASMRFELDGRSYALRVRPAALSHAAG